MGTNYYFYVKETISQKEAYTKLLENDEIDLLNEYIQNGFHVGKSSFGWRFVFHKQDRYENLEELKEFYNKHSDVFELYDEYGRPMDFEKFLAFVEGKQTGQVGTHCELQEDGTAWLDCEFS